MSINHDWLNLIEVSGPFLSTPVLREAFPQGLEGLPRHQTQRLRQAYDEWRDAVESADPDLKDLHRAWINEVLTTGLDMGLDVLRYGDTIPEIPEGFHVPLAEHNTTIAPDIALIDETQDNAALLLLHVLEPDDDLDSTRDFAGRTTTPAERMITLLRATDCPLGIVTNGERWMLIHCPTGSIATYASWYARLWGQEPDTLRAFVSLLGVRRFFGPEEDNLPTLFTRSLVHQDDVTDALGEQVRRAVEVLVQSLDRADQDRNRKLLADVDPGELYEAGLTVMMRLVFLLAAEERELLLLGEPRYDSYYAISSLRTQLRAETEEILERRRAAWPRLLALFRAVYGGVNHTTMSLPALGGSLFDPDRFSFLEGRPKGTTWRTHPAEPLPIDDRTVLLLLEAIQTFEGRTLSYQSLDVEQIGHVYEGLLERTVKRIDDVTLELEASAKAEAPRVALGEIESAELDGRDRLMELLVERSQRSESAVRNSLGRQPDDGLAARILTVCQGDVALRDRLLPYAHLLRTDPWGYPLIHHSGAFIVVRATERRDTGTHYTPKSLTEKIIEKTLTPVVYHGPADGEPREKWELKSANELLDLKICDPAMGSGAFLVQACRWLGERLVEAWAQEEATGRIFDSEGNVRSPDESNAFDLLAHEPAERTIIARRLIAERCLYGVDLNPLAVELAKLSLWLTTLAKGRPFGFLDHNLKTGDSLLGVHKLEQLQDLKFDSKREQQTRLFDKSIRAAIDNALKLRQQLRSLPLRDIHDINAMAALHAAAQDELDLARKIADVFIGSILRYQNPEELEGSLSRLAALSDLAMQGNTDARESLLTKATSQLSMGTPDGRKRLPFHWPLEYPEVFLKENGGFDAIVGNPPFLGNRFWKGVYGERFQWQCEVLLRDAPGKIDLCIVFHRRAADLLRESGGSGLLATTNIAEGSAINVGLGVLVEDGDIYFSRKGVRWPGKASVFVAIVCFHKGKWQGDKDADGQSCARIGPRLTPEEFETWQPQKLKSAPFSFEGVHNSRGLAFVLTEDAPWFQRLYNEPNSLLRPYVTGSDITGSALTRIERWALDIGVRTLGDIRAQWPLAYEFLNEVVKPTRTPEALKSYKGLSDRWWQFWNHRAPLLKRLRRNSYCIAYSKHTKHTIGMLAPTDWIYINSVLLLPVERGDEYSISLSSLFRKWLETYSSRHLSNVFRLSITQSVAKYPLPQTSVSDSGVNAAARFNDIAVNYSKSHGCGLTEIMNAVNSPTEMDSTIQVLRDLLQQIDHEVASAYGWDNLDLAYDFHASDNNEGTDRDWRWAPSPEIKTEILHRLRELNRLRCMEESNQE